MGLYDSGHMSFDASETPALDNDPHANDAAPYGGGDPYADYRTTDLPSPNWSTSRTGASARA